MNDKATHAPDYNVLTLAARRQKTPYTPLYEHAVSPKVLSSLSGRDLISLWEGGIDDKTEAFRTAAGILADLGYDAFPFEGCVTELIQGGKGLMGIGTPIIRDKQDLLAFPWEEIPDRYFKRFDTYFQALERALPPGMRAYAGVGNGVFEIAQDFVPMTDLAFLEIDEHEVFAELWVRIGRLLMEIWSRFLRRYDTLFCLYRFGDDLGFKSSLLIKPETFKTHIAPQYKRLIGLIKSTGKPFLLHSCGAIFEIMEELIADCRIDAKHSNEDAIVPFDRWVESYGERIALFGGIDMNVLCSEDETGIREYVRDLVGRIGTRPGLALGSGNQIADYVPPEAFLAMVDELNRLRFNRSGS